MEFSKRAILSRRHIDGFTKFEISLKKFWNKSFKRQSTSFLKILKIVYLKSIIFIQFFLGRKLNYRYLKIFTDSQEIILPTEIQ